MSFLNKNINLDIGHIILIVALIVFVIFVAQKCTMSCGVPAEEGLLVDGGYTVNNQGKVVGFDLPLPYKSPCACSNPQRQKCAQAVLEKARRGELYGCNPSNPYVPFSHDECNYQAHKAILHGCQGG